MTWKNFFQINLKFGSKEARQSVLSYDEASKRIPDSELARLKKTFRKDATNDYLSKNMFARFVLGDSVPSQLSEAIFYAFGGGSKGISFKDLLTGLVLISYGTEDEKIQFLFHLVSGGSNSMPLSELFSIVKSSEDGKLPQHVVQAFGTAETINAQQFHAWISKSWRSMAWTQWLLENDFKPALIPDPGQNEIPTFYQTLAGVTHLNEKEIFDLEKFYASLKSLSQNGRFDVSLFAVLVSPPLPSTIAANLFQAFDENCDGHIDLKELVCGVSACCRGPMTERLKFCFKVFDFGRRKHLTKDEFVNALQILLDFDDSSKANDYSALCNMADDILQSYSESNDIMTLENFLHWSLKSNVPQKFIRLLFQVCHVVLGLRPQHKEDELSSVIEWLQRDSRRPKSPGDTYYVLNGDWWRNWRRYMEDVTLDVITDGEVSTNGRKRSNALNLSEIVKLPSRSASRASTPTLSRSSSTISVQSRHPGSINNVPILVPESNRVRSLTDEGGVLKKRSDGSQLREGEDFVLVCDAVWKAFSHWYSGGPEIPRQCVALESGEVDIDVFPFSVKLFKHRIVEVERPYGAYPYGGMVSGYAATQTGLGTRTIVERIFFANACFHSSTKFYEVHDVICRKLRVPSDSLRLWIYPDEDKMTLLEDESVTIASSLTDGGQLLVEIRNKDLTWPEEMEQLAKPSNRRPYVSRSGSISREDGTYEKGCCGLNNLGNTCFMNSALQCVSYCRPLTFYFRTQRFCQEINRANPIGYGGLIAEKYAELIAQLWSGRFRCTAPLKLRSAICKHRPAFNGCQQHDSQELLAFILDGLHEDLNRVHQKPYVELKDSEGRDDQVVAQEAWENHLRRNQSIVVDLFHGLLKSRVKCLTCCKASIRFDPFSVLSLPLPLDNLIHLDICLARSDGGGIIKYGLRVEPECTFGRLREAFAKVSGYDSEEIIPLEVVSGLVRRVFNLADRIQSITLEGRLLMYQIPQRMKPQKNGVTARKWVLAFHRRMVHNENYYMTWARATPKIFGIPIMLARDDGVTNRDMYEGAWQQIKRFIGPEASQAEETNHAQECDALSSAYCFTLKSVRDDGCWCSSCPWYAFCRGCPIAIDDEPFGSGASFLVIDWEPTFYHLRYQDSLEHVVIEHESCRIARLEHTEPITLDSCLRAFTHEEELGPDALYQCNSCKEPRLASKRMQLWQPPPVMVVHLKRFQKVREQWVKSHKIVTFPFRNLDLSSYIAAPDAPMTPDSAVEEAPVNSGHSQTENGHDGDCTDSDSIPASRSDGDSGFDNVSSQNGDNVSVTHELDIRAAGDELRNAVADNKLQYDLYAICCHSGNLATGHYVSYCKNPNGKWYLFNDSSCKEIPETQIDSSTAYMLFYERKGLDYASFLPELVEAPMQASDSVDGAKDESVVDSNKHYCTLQ